MTGLNTTVETGDVTVIAVEQNSGVVYGKTIDADGSECVWQYDGFSVGWIDDPDYYIRTKTREALDDMALGLEPEFDGPGLEGLTTGWDEECTRCGYVGPMNIQKRKPTMDSETLHVCPECGLNNA